MQLSLRTHATVGVAVIGAGLIYVTPPATPDIGQPIVALAAAWDVIDLVGPVDSAVRGLGGVDASAVASPADAELPVYLEPEFWELWWSSLGTINPIISWFLLVNALAEVPIIGPVFTVVGLLSYGLFLFGPYPAVADADADAGGSVGDSPDLENVVALFGGAPGWAESSAALDDPGAIVELGAVMSIVDPAAMGDLVAVLDSAEGVDPSILPSIIAIPELDNVLTSLIP